MWQWRHKGARMYKILPSQFQGSKAKPSTLFLSNFGFLALFLPHLSPAGRFMVTGPMASISCRPAIENRSRCWPPALWTHLLCTCGRWDVGRTTKPEAFKENACAKFRRLCVSICMSFFARLHTKRQPKRQRCLFPHRLRPSVAAVSSLNCCEFRAPHF